MNKQNIKKQLDLITRGSEEIIGKESLIEKLKSGKKLRVKFGADPTAPDLHLGHTVVMEKLRQFQELGHTVIFIIGDFTARIGDPSGRSKERPVLSEEEIEKSIAGFKEQIFKVLKRDNIKLVRNSSWLEKLGASGIIKLASKYTVARMLERNDFSKRYNEGNPISITEFLYPLLQGYDSVEVEADVEIGGTDQKFNLLVGRELQKNNSSPQSILTMPLLEGTDGVQKMSKSYGNHIGINEKPSEMFGKIMSVSDDMMYRYYKLLTVENMEKIKKLHPMKAKKKLARKIIEKYHGPAKAKRARKNFERVFSKGKTPEDMDSYKVEKEEKLVDIIASKNILSSKSQIKRYINQGAVSVDGEKIKNRNYTVSPGEKRTVKIGKRNFLKLT
ncbi:MAG: tyrosine--tRNA ligase [Elusimicrobiota bacterium]